MIDGIKERQKSEMEEALAQLSDSNRQILDSVITNDEYYLKVTGNLLPTPTNVAKLPDIHSQGFLLIYNQLQELLGEKKSATGSATTKGLGKIFESLGIGMQSIGKGFSMLGQGLAAMGNPMVFVGIAATSLILVALMAFIAGLSALENAGLGITTLLQGLADVLVSLIGGLANVLTENQSTIELLLNKFIESLEFLPPIIEKVGEACDKVLPHIVDLFTSLGNTIVGLVANFDDIIDALGRFVSSIVDTVFESITDSLERLSELDGLNMLLVAGGVAALAGALALFGVSGLATGFLNFIAGKGLIEKLERFAVIGQDLRDAGEGLKALAEGMKAFGSATWDTRNFSDDQIDQIIGFVVQFNTPAFKSALAGLKGHIADFDLFSSALERLASSALSLGDMDDRKYRKAYERAKELLSISKEASGELGMKMAETLSSTQAAGVNDAIFTLEDSDNTGTYFQTDKGLVRTNPRDNLSVIASTNNPEGESTAAFETIAEKFDLLLEKLDGYVEAIATKEPDVTVLPQGETLADLNELLRVGV